MRKYQGFTMVELVIVIVILGVLSAVAAPKFINIQSEAKIAAAKTTLGAVRAGITMAHGKILASGVSTGSSGNNPNWPTLVEVQKNKLLINTRPAGLQVISFVQTDAVAGALNASLPRLSLPDMAAGMTSSPRTVTDRSKVQAYPDQASPATTVRVANEASGWAYFPGDESTSGHLMGAVFYINDDRVNNIDSVSVKPSNW